MRERTLSILILLYFGSLFYWVAARGNSYQEAQKNFKQPVAFSHQTHAGKLKLSCTYCHTTAEKSLRAGVPPMATCIACHGSPASDQPEIAKLRRYWNNREPIAWVKIHNLPDHVYFTHKRHSRAGIGCANCHGEVTFMEQIRQVRSLRMNWCLACHRATGANTDCLTCHQ